MTQTFTPRPYQTLIINHILDNPFSAIFASMGMGKTSSTLTAIDILSFVDNAPVLVLAPKRVALTTWVDECKKWSHLNHLKVVPIIGTTAQRKLALTEKADIFTMNYENLPWLVEHLGKHWRFKTVIADESTRLKSYRTRQGGKRAKYLAKQLPYIERFVLLTGTPSPNGLQDLWGQIFFLDKGQRLGSSFKAFTNRWFNWVQKGADRFVGSFEPHDFAQSQIQEKLKDICLTIDAKDWFNLDEPIETVIEVALPEKVQEMYTQLEQEMFLELENGHEIEAFNAAAKTMKCLQLANGALYQAQGYYEVHSAKLDALESIIEEAAGMPVLVAYHFKSDLARLQKKFKQGKPLDTNPQTIKDWNAGKIPVLFAHPASAGHGLNLQDGGNILAMFGHWWDLEQYQQIVERIGAVRQKQAGHDRPVYIYQIVAKNTIDRVVLERRKSKAAVQDLLLQAMKTRQVKNECNR